MAEQHQEEKKSIDSSNSSKTNLGAILDPEKWGKLLSQVGSLKFAAIIAGMMSSCLFLAMLTNKLPKIVDDNIWIEYIVLIVMILLGLASITLFIIAWRHRQLDESPPSNLQDSQIYLIAWAGYENRGIYDGKRPKFLTYNRPFDVLPLLDIRNNASRLFDVIVVDVELVKRYQEKGAFDHIGVDNQIYRKYITDQGWVENLVELTRSAVIDKSNNLWSVPLRFGMQEILIGCDCLDKWGIPTRQEVKSGKTVMVYDENLKFDHSKFNILTLPKNVKVGLWGWYLPTLTTLLLTAGVSINDIRMSQTGEGKYHKIVQSKLSEIASKLTKLAQEGRLKILRNPVHIYPEFNHAQLDILFGGGSWATPMIMESKWRDVAVIIPNDELPIYVDCFGLASRWGSNFYQKDVRERLEFLDQLLKIKSQLALASDPQYLSLPVRAEALAQLMCLPLEKKYPVVRTWEILKNRNRLDLLSLRCFPQKTWTNWVAIWEEIERAEKTYSGL